MSTTKHTPGPWTVSIESHGAYVYQGSSDNCVAEAFESLDNDGEANARLIAAAPELLEWLEYTCNLLSRLPRLSDVDRIDAPGEAASVLKSARAAIAKAAGTNA